MVVGGFAAGPMAGRASRAIQAQQQLRRHLAALHRQHLGTGPADSLKAFAHPGQVCGGEAVSAAHQHQIGRPQLILEQLFEIGEVIEAGVGGPLPLKRFGVGHHTAASQRFAIHHRHHAIDTGAGTDVRPLEGLHQGLGQRQTAGFHHDAVEAIGGRQQFLHRRQEIVLNGAAEAAVGEFHQPAFELFLRAEAAAAQQVTVDAHFAEFIDQHRQTQAAGGKQMAQQSGFARAEKARHHSDGQTPLHGGCHLRAPAPTRRMWSPHRSARRPPASAAPERCPHASAAPT